jgi:hypothetical protein
VTLVDVQDAEKAGRWEEWIGLLEGPMSTGGKSVTTSRTAQYR